MHSCYSSLNQNRASEINRCYLEYHINDRSQVHGNYMDRESLILWSEQTTLPCITTNKQNPVSRLYSNEQSQYLSNLIVSFDYIALLSEEKNKIK